MGSRRPPLNELVSLYQSLVAAEGITTGAGAATGDSFIDAALIVAGAGSFLGMTAILYPGDPDAVDSAITTVFNNATGEVTMAEAYKGVAAAIPVGVAYKIINLKAISAEALALLQDIFDLVNAILMTAETGDTITTTAAEQDMYVNNAPAGVFKPLALTVNTTNMVAGDIIVIRSYERISPIGALELQSEKQFNDAQHEVLKKIPLYPNRSGVETTIQRVAVGVGGDKAYVWAVVLDV